MDSVPLLSIAELNARALERFLCRDVDEEMIAFLAAAAADVIQCDSSMMPPPQASWPRKPSARDIESSDAPPPTIKQFVTWVVVSSNTQAATLMSSLVYLCRLKSRLHATVKGRRCATHRIFLASLILAAKYLNDTSPMNEHWAKCSVMSMHNYNFGFSCTEVNLMEKQLLFLLDWDLRITEEDLYRELEHFLAPLRLGVQERHICRTRRKMERKRAEAREGSFRAEHRLAPPITHGSLELTAAPSPRGISRSGSHQPSYIHQRPPPPPIVSSLSYAR